jgi:hypothetical protein
VAVFPCPVAGTMVTSHEVELLFRVLFAPSYRAHWVNSIPSRPSCFQAVRTVFLAAPSPVFLRLRVHPLVNFASSPEYNAASNLPADRSRRAPFLGFRPPSRHQCMESTYRRVPSPAYGPPSAFLTLSTDYPSLHLLGLFRPRATCEIHPTGVFPAT